MTSTEDFFRSIALTDVVLRVKNLERMRTFYEGLIGLRVLREAAGRLELGADAGGPVLIRLDEDKGAPARPQGTAGLFHVAILLPTRAALGRMARRLVEQAVDFGTGDHGVSEALYLDDPEGNGVELYADRAVTAWPAAQADGQVTMYTEAVDLEELVAAGGPGPGGGVPAGTRIGHLHICVSALERAETFYAGVLGFPIRQRSFGGALFFGRDGYHHHFGANVWRSRFPAVPGVLGLAGFTVRFADEGELTRAIAAAEVAELIVTRDVNGERVRDLDGIELELKLGVGADGKG